MAGYSNRSFLLIGGDAEIGSATAWYLRRRGRAVAATTRRPECVSSERPLLDLAGSLDSWEPPSSTVAACIFAAVARLLDCARDPIRSCQVNVTGTLALIQKLRSYGIPVLWLSTDKVFDGSRAHIPSHAPPNPVSEYGRQKAETETALRLLPLAILRLAKVVSPGTPLLMQWVRSLTAGEPVQAFHDMKMAPTPIALVRSVIEKWLDAPVTGVFQLSGPRDVSYAEAADYLARKFGADPALVQRVSAFGAGLPEGSTAQNTTLDSSAVAERYGIVVPDVWTIVDNTVDPVNRPLS